jgi:spore germination protein
LVNGRYTVRSGDSLSVIAAMFDTTVGAIVRANELDDPNDIVAGQRLIIPGASPSPAPRPSR